MNNRARRSCLVLVALGCAFLICSVANADEPAFGWRVGPTAWSFNPFTFFDAIDKAAALGMPYLEAFEGQRVNADSEAKLDANLPDETIQEIIAKLDQAKVKLTSIYIHNIPADDEGCRRTFEFARKLRVEFIVSEPAPETLDTIERFCNEYAISVAIHNHPKGKSIYWNPKDVLKACEGRGPRIGACGDTGHWLRSGLKPVDAVRLLGKRLIALHLKDLDKAAPDAHDVPWGKGCGNMAGVLGVLRELRLKPGLFGIEYESNFDNNLAQIAECGKWFAEATAALAADANREDPLFVGWASVDITPPRPVALVGQFHKRLSKSVRDPLTATALAIETRGPNGQTEQAVLVSCDLVGMHQPIPERVQKAVKSRVSDLDPRKITINCTHTHTGPGLLDSTYGDRYDVSKDPGAMTASEYGDFFVQKATDAVVEAWKNRAPAGMSWGLGHAAVGINRRAQYFDGTAVLYGDAGRETFSSFEGGVDPGIDMLFFWTPEHALTGMVLNIVCPSQETEGLEEVSADFWHEVRQEVRRRQGSDVFILPQCSAAGDISPHPMFRKAAEAAMIERSGISRRQLIANRIAAAVDDVLPGAKGQVKTAIPLRHLLVDLDLPEKQPPDEPFSKTDPVHPIQFHVLRIGDVAMATNPFELFLDYGLRIEARSRPILTFLVQLSDASCGYLPTDKAVKGGGYSAEKYIVPPEGGQILVNETVSAINSLWP